MIRLIKIYCNGKERIKVIIMIITFNKELFQAAQRAIREKPNKRVLPVEFSGKKYFIKRRMSNGRNAFAKHDPSESFWYEAYQILTVNSHRELAPKIVLLEENFFVMEGAGKTMQGVAKEAPYTSCRDEAFYKTGQALSQLHALGLHHGRPALRDIAYDKETGKITLLDWENQKSFIHAPKDVLDVFLFLHSCFREEWPDTHLQNQFMQGYQDNSGNDWIVQQLKKFTADHHKLLAACHALTLFHWIDVTAVDWAKQYIEKI